MKKIILIILMMIAIGCESKNTTAVEYPTDEVSSSIDIMSSSSENISMSSDAINSSGSINNEISSSLSSSSLLIISSSSVSRSSSSHLEISSSSYNQTANSSSSNALKSSNSIGNNSSSSYQSSSSEIVNHASNIFLFDLDSALTNAYFKTMNGDDSPLYEVIANKIMQYKTYYGWDTIVPPPYPSVSKSMIVGNGYFLTKTFASIINGMIQDQSSPYLETIDINYHKYGTTYTVMRLLAKTLSTNASSSVLFEASEVTTVNGYKTFILRRNIGNEISCNWYNESEGKWKTAGFNLTSSQAGYNSKCNIVANYGLD